MIFLFDIDGTLLLSIGDRGADPPRSQDPGDHAGKLLRLNADGSVPDNNPFVGQESVQPEIWSLGHRNPLCLAFDAEGRLWNHEMGPRHGGVESKQYQGRQDGEGNQQMQVLERFGAREYDRNARHHHDQGGKASDQPPGDDDLPHLVDGQAQ